LSTRVHELAKELGLKSAELLERIQGWGLDVKASNFASLDPATVERIRALSGAPKGQAPQVEKPAVRASSPPVSVSQAPPARAAAPEAPAPRLMGGPTVGPAGKTPEAPAASRPQVLAPGSSPAAAGRTRQTKGHEN
jgi:hypothetical protein